MLVALLALLLALSACQSPTAGDDAQIHAVRGCILPQVARTKLWRNDVKRDKARS